MKNFLLAFALVCVLGTGIASAHVTVKPTQVAPAAFQLFSTSVPNEKEVPVTAVRLLVPTKLQHVTPTVKPGWTINVKKDGETITEIIWTGGTIPPSQRDDFTFSAQAPAESTTLDWKAYQTYEDGSVVSWDQDPNAEEVEGSERGPLSQTKVSEPTATDSSSTALWLSIAGIVLALAALGLTVRKA